MFQLLIDPDANHGIGVGFTDRHGGVSGPDLGPLNLGRTDLDDLSAVETNFDRVRRSVGVSRVITAHQVHGADVVTVDEPLLDRWGPRAHLGQVAGQSPLPVADALVTRLPDVALCIRVADCVPIVLADHHSGVLGAVHAGREGYRAGVLTAAVSAMRDLGAGPDLMAWVGPHICGQCYEVPATMAEQVSQTHPWAVSTTTWGTPSIDLGAGVEHDLIGLGVEVVRADPCTRTEPDLHSHRRDAERAGRLGALIWRVSGGA